MTDKKRALIATLGPIADDVVALFKHNDVQDADGNRIIVVPEINYARQEVKLVLEVANPDDAIPDWPEPAKPAPQTKAQKEQAEDVGKGTKKP